MDSYPRTRLSEAEILWMVTGRSTMTAKQIADMMVLLLEYDLDMLATLYGRMRAERDYHFLDGRQCDLDAIAETARASGIFPEIGLAWKYLYEANAVFALNYFGKNTLIGGWPVLPGKLLGGFPPLVPSKYAGLFNKNQDRAAAEVRHNDAVMRIYMGRFKCHNPNFYYVDYDFIVRHLDRRDGWTMSMMWDEPEAFSRAVVANVDDIPLDQWEELIVAMEFYAQKNGENDSVATVLQFGRIDAETLAKWDKPAQLERFERGAHAMMTAFRASHVALERGIESKFDWIVARMVGSAVPEPKKAYRWTQAEYVPRPPLDYAAVVERARQVRAARDAEADAHRNNQENAWLSQRLGYTEAQLGDPAFMNAELTAFRVRWDTETNASRTATNREADRLRAVAAAEARASRRAVLHAGAEARLRRQ